MAASSLYSPRWEPVRYPTHPGSTSHRATHTRFRGSELGAADGLLPSLAPRVSAVAPVYRRRVSD